MRNGNAALLKAKVSIKPPDLFPVPSNDGLLAVAETFSQRNKGRLAYVIEEEDKRGWRYYDGTRWVPDPVGVGFNKFYDEMLSDWYRRASFRDNNTEGSSGAGKVAAEYDSSKRWEIEKLVKPKLPVNINLFDTHPHLLNTPNGTVDLRSGELLKHDPEHLITQVTHVRYNPGAGCERFEKFLKEITLDRKSLEECLRSLLGYSITGETREQIFTIFQGGGGNGKGVLISSIIYALGDDYTMSIQKETILKAGRRGNEALREMYRARNKRLMVVDEPEGEWSTSEIKQWTGQDRVQARGMYRGGIEYDPVFKIIPRVNNLPSLTEVSTATRRRFRIYPFEADFTGAPDKLLTTNLKGEAEGILALLVREAVEYYRSGSLKSCNEIEISTEDYLEGEAEEIGRTSLEKFLEDRGWKITSNESDVVIKSDLKEDYEEWCRLENIKPMNRNDFPSGLKSLGIGERKGGKGKRFWTKLRKVMPPTSTDQKLSN